MSDLFVKTYDRQDHRLGRQVVFDPRSRNFAFPQAVDKSQWRDKAVRIYDPLPNPNQCHGECTGVAKVMGFNAVNNRRKGRVLGMHEAHQVYSLATTKDPWDGSWPPTDTGSSGLAAAKAAVDLGLGGEYRHIFNGADGIIQAIQDGWAVNVGTRWDFDMFEQDRDGRIRPGGGTAGGHMWIARRYWKDRDWVGVRCWWGGFRDAWIARTDLDSLMADYGEAHVQQVVL